MSKRGWHLNALQNPPALHMAFTVRGHAFLDIQTGLELRFDTETDGHVGREIASRFGAGSRRSKSR